MIQSVGLVLTVLGAPVAHAGEPPKQGVAAGVGLAPTTILTVDQYGVPTVNSNVGVTSGTASLRFRRTSGWVFEPQVRANASRSTASVGNEDESASSRGLGLDLGAHRRIAEKGRVEGLWLTSLGTRRALWEQEGGDFGDYSGTTTDAYASTGLRAQMWLQPRLVLSIDARLLEMSVFATEIDVKDDDNISSRGWDLSTSPKSAIALHIYL